MWLIMLDVLSLVPSPARCLYVFRHLCGDIGSLALRLPSQWVDLPHYALATPGTRTPPPAGRYNKFFDSQAALDLSRAHASGRCVSWIMNQILSPKELLQPMVNCTAA